MNILFVHEIDWLRKVVFEIHTLSELLSLKGHNVYAIDYESMWEKDSPFDFGSLRTSTINNVARAYTGASVTLIRPGFIKIPGLSRLTAALTHSSELKKTIIEKNIDVIILYSVPTSGLQTLRLAEKLGVPVIFRSIDIPNQLVRFPPLRPITRILENKVYSRADLILPISPRLSEYVIRMSASPDKVQLLPLGTDTEVFHPGVDSRDLRNKWGIGENDPVITFIGTTYNFSGLDTFIKNFPNLLEKVPGAKLMIVGDGPQRPELEKIISDTGLVKKVLITGFQPYETMPAYINMAAVCINPFRITDTTRDIFPTKILQYMACGKATVATPLPGTQALAEGEKQGIAYASEPGDFIAEVASLLISPERRRKLGEAGLSYVKQTHGYDKIANQFEAVISEVTGKGQAS